MPSAEELLAVARERRRQGDIAGSYAALRQGLSIGALDSCRRQVTSLLSGCNMKAIVRGHFRIVDSEGVDWTPRGGRERAVIALLFGVLGMGLWVLGIHLYQDHTNLHTLVNIEAQRQQAIQQAQQKPAPPAK